MELYISRSGAVEGPYSVEKIQSMLRDGHLSASDLGAHPGASDWSPLSQLIECPRTDQVAPPPFPAQPDNRFLDQQFMIDGKILPGTHGKSVRQMVDEIASGGRFVIYQYVFSIIVMSFRRSSPIAYVPPGRSGAAAAFGWSLISLCFGWWGLPWGIIFTIGALWRNTSGGVDVTEPILAQMIGPAQADALVRRRPKQPSGALWGIRALILSPLLLLVLLIALGASGGSQRAKDRAKQPGYSGLMAAQKFVGHPDGKRGQGNTPAAARAAVEFSNTVQAFRSIGISDEKPGKNKNITTWCEVHPGRCLFIVEVPDLRHFTDDAKSAMADAAWLAAQLGAKELGLPESADLAVALRGSVLYDRLITGKPAAAPDPQSADFESVSKSSIRSTKKGGAFNQELMRYFVDPSI